MEAYTTSLRKKYTSQGFYRNYHLQSYTPETSIFNGKYEEP